MASLEISPIAENAHGAAFEVKIKNNDAGAEKPKTAARLRLEASAAGAAAKEQLPSLLQSRSAMQTASMDRAEKARQQNEQKREAVERVRAEMNNSASAKRQGLEQQLEKASEKREGALAEKRARAVKHLEIVQVKTGARQQREAETAAALKQRLQEASEQKMALRTASLAERTARASQHNEAVAGKVLQHQEAMQRQTEELRCESALNRFALLCERLYERHYVARPQ